MFSPHQAARLSVLSPSSERKTSKMQVIGESYFQLLSPKSQAPGINQRFRRLGENLGSFFLQSRFKFGDCLNLGSWRAAEGKKADMMVKVPDRFLSMSHLSCSPASLKWGNHRAARWHRGGKIRQVLCPMSSLAFERGHPELTKVTMPNRGTEVKLSRFIEEQGKWHFIHSRMWVYEYSAHTYISSITCCGDPTESFFIIPVLQHLNPEQKNYLPRGHSQ